LTLGGQILCKLKIQDYRVPETSGIKIGQSENAEKYSHPRPQLLPYLPNFMKRWITNFQWPLGKQEYIGPKVESNPVISVKSVHNLYINMLSTRMKLHWFSYVPYQPQWVQKKALAIYKMLGYGRLDMHRSELMLELLEQIDKALRCRALFIMEKGLLGLGSDATRKGDKIFCMGNGKLPFTLRAFEETDTYFLLGKCYVHGIMDGELWASSQSKASDTHQRHKKVAKSF
jgi:hypothetical protein